MKQLLLWGDAPHLTTGFGKLNNEILQRVYALGNYEITVIGVNYMGDFYDKEKYPFAIHQARRGADGLGIEAFREVLKLKKWDVIITTLDIGQINRVTQDIVEARIKQGFNWIVYTPVDNDQILPDGIDCLRYADLPVVYSQFGKDVITTLDKEVGSRVRVGYLGTDTQKFRSVTKAQKREYRKKYFNIENDDTFLAINVNANRWRKDMPRSLWGFKLFNDKITNSKLYIHAPIVQQDGGNLAAFAKTTRCREGSIILNAQMDPLHGTPEGEMYKIYGCADVVVSSTMSEGWGLSCTEAFACGIPALFPRHTSLVEMVGENQERGYHAELSGEMVLAWNYCSYWRPLMSVQSFADQLHHIWSNRDEAIAKTKVAQEWVKQFTWDRLFNIFRESL
jgi:hypothetical protein